jgi:DHA1 family tetracycline resistance protein-like MFS transporter
MSRDLILVAFALITWGIGEGMFLFFEPLYLQQLGANPVMIGGILGSIGSIMAVSYIPAGILSDRLGRRPMLRLAWVIGLTATIIMAIARTLPAFIAGMAIYGFTSFVAVPLNSYITHARGNWTVGRTITLISASFNMGFILGPLIGGWIGENYGLRYTFSVAAVIFVISTVIIFFIGSQPVEPRQDQVGGASPQTFINLRYLQFLAISFVVTFALYLPQPLSQNYLQNEQGLNLEQIGQLIAMRSIGIVILNLALGQLNARLGYLLAQGCMALFTILLLGGSSLPWFLLGYFLLGSYQTARVLTIAQGRALIHSSYLGIGYGLIETAMTFAIILAPLLAGIIYQQNPGWIYSISLVLICIGILITIFLYPVHRSDLANQ